MIPDFVFDKNWQKAGFLIPEDWAIRSEMRQQYELCLRSGAMHMSSDEGAKTALQARIAAIDAYNDVHFKAKAKSAK